MLDVNSQLGCAEEWSQAGLCGLKGADGPRGSSPEHQEVGATAQAGTSCSESGSGKERTVQKWIDSFSNSHCAQTAKASKASNDPISVLSLHPAQKTPMPGKLRKPRFNQYHMLFFLFSWLLFCLRLSIARARNSPVFMSELCWVLCWHVTNTNTVITNLVL